MKATSVWTWGLPVAPPARAHTYTRGSRRMVVDFIAGRESTTPRDIVVAFGMNRNAIAKLLRDAMRRGEIRRVCRGVYALAGAAQPPVAVRP